MGSQVRTILQLEVPVIVQVGRLRMSLDDVLALQPGSILELEKPADDELSVLINNKPIGVGEAVKVGENFGLRLTQIGSARQRIEALGGEGGSASAPEDEATPAGAEPAAAASGEAPGNAPATSQPSSHTGA